tara:strand:+ start:48 stop:239 length:192 start_codon:yes stop_codon:yes gene_type:complete
MIEFLWHVPVFLWELALNVAFWGSISALVFLIVKWGTEKWIETMKSEKEIEESDQGNRDNWGV